MIPFPYVAMPPRRFAGLDILRRRVPGFEYGLACVDGIYMDMGKEVTFTKAKVLNAVSLAPSLEGEIAKRGYNISFDYVENGKYSGDFTGPVYLETRDGTLKIKVLHGINFDERISKSVKAIDEVAKSLGVRTFPCTPHVLVENKKKGSFWAFWPYFDSEKNCGDADVLPVLVEIKANGDIGDYALKPVHTKWKSCDIPLISLWKGTLKGYNFGYFTDQKARKFNNVIDSPGLSAADIGRIIEDPVVDSRDWVKIIEIRHKDFFLNSWARYEKREGKSYIVYKAVFANSELKHVSYAEAPFDRLHDLDLALRRAREYIFTRLDKTRIVNGPAYCRREKYPYGGVYVYKEKGKALRVDSFTDTVDDLFNSRVIGTFCLDGVGRLILMDEDGVNIEKGFGTLTLTLEKPMKDVSTERAREIVKDLLNKVLKYKGFATQESKAIRLSKASTPYRIRGKKGITKIVWISKKVTRVADYVDRRKVVSEEEFIDILNSIRTMVALKN